MRSRPVVVLHVGSEHMVELAVRQDQQVVEALGANGLDPALGVAVRRGAGTGVRTVLMPSVRSTSSNTAVELEVAVADQERRRRPASWELKDKVACHLGHPACVGVGGGPGQADGPAPDLDHEQAVEALPENGVDVEEVRRQHAGRLGAEEVLPA